jgi:lipopolysaccharide biosynthesis glycosyltransferase/tetratricopeptide (TPR) repeat protein
LLLFFRKEDLPSMTGIAAFFADKRVQAAMSGPRAEGAGPLVQEFLSQFTYADCSVGQLLVLADLAGRAGDTEVAALALRQVIARGAKLHLAHYKLGRLLLLQSKPQDAAEEFDLGAAADPQFAFNFMGAARALWDQGRKQEALVPALRFAQFGVRPHGHEDITVLGELADFLFETGRRDEALSLYALIKSFGVNRPRHTVRLAEARIAAGDYPAAKAILLEQMASGAPDPWTRRALAVCFSQEGAHDIAIAHALAALQTNPKNPGFLSTFVRVVGKSNDPATIRHALTAQATILTPADATELRVRLLLAEDDQASAAQTLQRAAIVPDSRLFSLGVETAYHALAVAYYDIAGTLAAMLDRISPDDVTVKILQIDILFRQLRWEEAGEILAKLPQEDGERPQLTMKRLEYACFTADRETASSASVQLEALAAANHYLMVPVFRFLAEQQDWGGVVDRALPWLDGTLNYGQIGYVLFRAAKHSRRQADMLAAIHALPDWASQAGLLTLRNSLAFDLADTMDAVDALLADPALAGYAAMREKLAIRRDVLARAGGQAERHAVFLCSDRNYLAATLVALFSLSRHVDAGRTDFFIVVDDDIADLTRESLGAFEAAGYTVSVVPASRIVASLDRLAAGYGLFTSGHRLSSAAYYRIYFARHLRSLGGYARAVYVDSDIVLTAALDGLFRIDLGGHPLAARLETPRPEVRRAIIHHGLAEGRYFNSGVLVFDLRHPDLDAALAGAVAAIADETVVLLYHDQCALNLGFRDRFAALDMAWNYPVTEISKLAEVPPGTGLLHFLERPKPWSAAYGGEAGPFWFAAWREAAAFMGEAAALRVFGEVQD